MRKFVISTLAAVSALALLLAGSPVRAGEMNIDDPAGDANGFFPVESTPRPSEEELDILGVKYSSTATEFKIDMKMAKIGIPVASAGFSYRLGFTHSGTSYHFLFERDEVPGASGSAFLLRQGATPIPCRCSGTINGKTATLEVKAEIASLSKALKSFNPDSDPIGPGTEFTGLSNTADRVMGVALIAVDWAKAAPDASFKF